MIYEEKDIKKAVVAAQAAIIARLKSQTPMKSLAEGVASAVMEIEAITPEEMYELALSAARKGTTP